MADMPPSRCREWRPAVDETAAKLLQTWKDTGALPNFDAALFAELTSTPSRISLADLINHRGGFKPIPPAKLKCGGSLGFFTISSDPFEYKFAETRSVEANTFVELCRASAADGLALWTWGTSIGLLLVRSDANGAQSFTSGPFHVGPGRRSPEHIMRVLKELRSAFAGSALHPDWQAVEQQLSAPELSVSAWFAAFGLPGAPDNSPANAKHVWAAWQRVVQALLTGQKPAPADNKQIKFVLEQSGSGEKLSPKPARGDGQVAYELASLGNTLSRTISSPEGSAWERRAQAANIYAQLAFSGDAAEWLTVGMDQKSLGASASLGRLLQLFPAEFRRDRCWALQTLHVAEVWNGHAFVQPLAALAEGRNLRLSLVVYPASLRPNFRQEFGIEGGADSPGRAWEAEGFIESADWPKRKPSELLPAWFVKQNADGVLIIVGAGSPTTRVWSGGKESGNDPVNVGLGRAPSEEEYARAGQALDAGILLNALGQGELLRAPVLESEAPVRGGARRDSARKSLSAEVPEMVSPSALGHLAEVRAPQLPRPANNGRLVCIEAAGLLSPEVAARDLAAHLGKGAEVWRDNGEVFACTESTPEWPLLAGLLGDVPAGASLKLVTSDGAGFRLVQT